MDRKRLAPWWLIAACVFLCGPAFAGQVPTPINAPSSVTTNHFLSTTANAQQAADSGKTVTTGDVVGTTDTQTLTNKTISGSNNTLTNVPASSLTGTMPSGAAPAYSGDCTSSAGSTVLTCTKTNGVAFGTAATQNTGTSGSTIPLLNGANTWSGAQMFHGGVATTTTNGDASFGGGSTLGAEIRGQGSTCDVWFGNKSGNTVACNPTGTKDLSINTTTDLGPLGISGTNIVITTSHTPATSSDVCTPGAIYWDASFLYVCTATNTWKRATLNAF